MRSLLLSLLIIILIALGLSPLIAGYLLKRHYYAYVAYLNQQQHSNLITITSYQEGWVRSTAQLSITPHSPNPSSLASVGMQALTINQNIMHGPILFGSDAQLGLAAIDTAFPLSQLLPLSARTSAMEQAIVRIDTIATFANEWRSTIKVPSVTTDVANVGQLTWNGLDGYVNASMQNDTVSNVDSKLVVGAINLIATNGHFQKIFIHPITFVSTSTHSPLALSKGTGSVSSDGFTLTKLDGKTVETHDLTISGTYGPENNNSEFSSITNGLIQKITLEGGMINQISAVKINYSVQHLNAVALLDFTKQIKANQNAGLQPKELQEDINSLLSLITPVSSIFLNISFDTNLGAVKVNVKLAWPDKVPLPKTLFDMLQVICNIDVKSAIPIVNQMINAIAQKSAEFVTQQASLNPSPALPTSVIQAAPPTSSDKFSDAMALLMQQSKIDLSQSLQIMDLAAKKYPLALFNQELKKQALAPDVEYAVLQAYEQELQTNATTPTQVAPAQVAPIAAAPQLPDQAAMTQQIDQKYQQQMDQLIQQGYIIKDSNDYVLHFTYANQQMKINGIPYTLPLPMGPGIQMPPAVGQASIPGLVSTPNNMPQPSTLTSPTPIPAPATQAPMSAPSPAVAP